MIAHPLLAILCGAGIGAILALTGAGGGILAVPVLVFALGLNMTQAAPVALLAVGLAAALGAGLGLRQGIVRYRAAGLIAVIGISMAPVGLYLAHRLPNEPLALLFSAVLLYVTLRMLRKATRELRRGQPAARPAFLPCVLNPVQGRLRWTLPCARAMALTGMLCGLLSGLLGVGGGFVIIPALTRATDLEMKSIVATSLAVIALVSIGSVTTAAFNGLLLWGVALPFAGGSVFGLVVGQQVASHLAGPRLQQGFALAGMLAAVLLAMGAMGVRVG